MPLVKLDIAPGIFADRSDYSIGPKWKTGSNVRFQQGLPEKIGGWITEVNWSFTGTPSDALAWTTLDGSFALVVGTDKKLELIFNDVKTDITPVRSEVTLNGPFDTTNTDATVTVNDTNHGAEDGDYVIFSGATAGGGITIVGEYVLTLVDANAYTIEHGSAATSSTTGQGGASVVTKYLIAVGNSTSAKGLGWGAGSWGNAREGQTSTTGAVTGITQANPGVVTATAHPFVNGDTVKLTGVAGMVEVNGVTYTVANKAANTFELSGINTTGFTAYTSAGTATKQWGWGYSANVSNSNVTLEPDLWSLSLWGEDLIATRRNGATYTWDATAPTARATIIANAPTNSKMSFVSVPDRHLVCLGAENGSEDPLNVRWSDQEDNTTWTASATNTAGSNRLSQGSKIIGAVQTRDQTLVFTDDAAFGMYFQGPPFTFGFRELGESAPPISQNAAIEVNGIVYWMGNRHFYMYDGTIKILPSPVRDHVFDAMDESLALLTYAGINRRFTEIIWLYATVGATAPNKYVTVNYTTGEWAFGSWDRAVWQDDLSWMDYPFAISETGTLNYHENGTSDNGATMTTTLESGVFEIPEAGEKLFMLDRVIPDATIGGGSMTVSLIVAKYPGGPETTKGPYTVTGDTEKISMRMRGRQVRLKLDSSGTEDSWKWGVARASVRPDGRGF